MTEISEELLQTLMSELAAEREARKVQMAELEAEREARKSLEKQVAELSATVKAGETRKEVSRMWRDWTRDQSQTNQENLAQAYMKAEAEGIELVSGGVDKLSAIESVGEDIHTLGMTGTGIHPRHADTLERYATEKRQTMARTKTRDKNAVREMEESLGEANGLL